MIKLKVSSHFKTSPLFSMESQRSLLPSVKQSGWIPGSSLRCCNICKKNIKDTTGASLITRFLCTTPHFAFLRTRLLIRTLKPPAAKSGGAFGSAFAQSSFDVFPQASTPTPLVVCYVRLSGSFCSSAGDKLHFEWPLRKKKVWWVNSLLEMYGDRKQDIRSFT